MWKHVRAMLALPGVMAVLVPAAILYFTGIDNFDLWSRALAVRIALAAIGVVFLGIGLVLFVATNRLFARIGRGTLAPWDPTSRLVVEGVYRHVRNPMMSAVFAVLLGEALLTASVGVFLWLVVFVTAVTILIPLVEERWLREQFGAEYEEYCRHVPRWIPRLRPWRNEANDPA